MSDQPKSDRFKAEMPQIPGVSTSRPQNRSAASNPAIRLVGGLLAVLVLCFVVSRFFLRSRHAAATAPAPPPQIEVPVAPVDSKPTVPHATAENPEIATVAEMAKPWSSKDFVFVNRTTKENTPALLIRLPTGSASQAQGYWAFALNSPYANCQFEYIKDMGKLNKAYDFHGAKHPMVGNPCNQSVFDPLRMSSIPGDNVWVRGGIVQGADLRPPLGIEVEIQGKNVLAVRME
jgi:hypothetical protein